jgi:thiamine kinase-like enzyme
MKNVYLYYRSWSELYDYIRAENCEIPKHLCKMMIDIDENEKNIWQNINKLPIVLCHRDYWNMNIFYTNNKFRIIDWDTTGFGYLGEDIASLIIDETDINIIVSCYKECIPEYYRGFSEYTDTITIKDNCIYELILIMFGYKLIEGFKFSESDKEKNLLLNILQKIYEIGQLERK